MHLGFPAPSERSVLVLQEDVEDVIREVGLAALAPLGILYSRAAGRGVRGLVLAGNLSCFSPRALQKLAQQKLAQQADGSTAVLNHVLAC
jgi:hypothetical protein